MSRMQGIGALATGVFVGCTYALLLARGNVVAALFATAIAGALMTVAWFTIRDRRLVALIGLAFAAQVAVAVVMHVELVAIGRGGFITGDDQEYARVSWGLVQELRGVPTDINWRNESYALGTFTYLEAGLFFLFGPDILLAKILNCGFLIGTVLLTFAWVRRLFGTAPAYIAAVLVAFYPSLILWSALNLKDTLALMLASALIWALYRFQLNRHWSALVLAGLILLPMPGLHGEFVLVLAVVIVIAVLVAPGLMPSRLRGFLIAAPIACSIAILGLDLGGARAGGLQLLQRVEQLREANAVGARTAIVEPIQRVRASQGDTFVVGAAPAVPRSSPSASPKVVNARPDARVVLEPSADTTEGNVVAVAPGDLLVVGPPGQPPAQPSQRRALIIDSRRTVQLVPADDGFGVISRTVLYLPRGLTYAILAPFPWAVGRAADLLTMPEMLAWYVCLVAAAVTAWSKRSVAPYLLPVYALVVGGLVAFALAEGNVGTLYRHRAMIIPSTIALASPTLVAFAHRARATGQAMKSSVAPKVRRRLLWLAAGALVLVAAAASLTLFYSWNEPSDISYTSRIDRPDSVFLDTYETVAGSIFFSATASRLTSSMHTDAERLDALMAWTHENVRPQYAAPVRTVADRALATVRRGFGYCDQSAHVFATLAHYAGYDARLLFLHKADGVSQHSVAEVWVGQRWVVVDPWLGVVWRDRDGHLVGVEALEAHPELLATFRYPAGVEVEDFTRGTEFRTLPYLGLDSFLIRKLSGAPESVTQGSLTVAPTVTPEPLPENGGDAPQAEVATNSEVFSRQMASYDRARRLHLDGQYREAAAVYEELLSEPTDTELGDAARFQLGLALLRSGDASGAVAAFDRALVQHPGTEWRNSVLQYRGVAKRASGDSPGAIQDLRSAGTPPALALIDEMAR